MPWLIGIDEAGYGPNLGPLVQASTPLLVPHADASVWNLLAHVVRRAGTPNDGRILVDDSKKVHDGAAGFTRLELGVLAVQNPTSESRLTLGELLKACAIGDSWTELLREPWFDVTAVLPLEADASAATAAARDFRVGVAKANLRLGPIRTVVTPTPRFNALLEKWGTKSAVLADGVIALLRQNRELPGGEPIIYLIDKLGGRNYYAAMIAEAFPDGWVVAEREGSEICSYRIIGLPREVRLVFQPRADDAHFTVAFASMVCKYLREVFMRQFNRWWQEQVPGLKPTAGYPADAGRFWKQIEARVQELGFDRSAVWRRK